MIDVPVLKLGGEFGGKVIHLDDDATNTGDEKIVTEHRRNGDAERGHIVMSAPETPGAIDTRLGEPASATPVKRVHHAQTVLSNPRNGDPLLR